MPSLPMMSAKLTPVASTRTRIWPAAGEGSGASFTSSTSGAPAFVIHTCRMGRVCCRVRVQSEGGEDSLPEERCRGRDELPYDRGVQGCPDGRQSAPQDGGEDHEN